MYNLLSWYNHDSKIRGFCGLLSMWQKYNTVENYKFYLRETLEELKVGQIKPEWDYGTYYHPIPILSYFEIWYNYQLPIEFINLSLKATTSWNS